jgi:hypothetical protein
MNFLASNFQALLEIDTHTVLYIQFDFRSWIHKGFVHFYFSDWKESENFSTQVPVFSPAFGLIRLPCLSVRIHDNSRTKWVRGFKFGMCTNCTKLGLVSKVGPNRVTRRPPVILIPGNATRFGSVAYKYRRCFVVLWNC